VKVRHDEDVASHIGPESCADTREGAGEASDRQEHFECVIAIGTQSAKPIRDSGACRS
jgi:hypothetical protein